VLRIDHVACAFTELRKLYAFAREPRGRIGTVPGTPPSTDIDADDLVS
jgi:hypothetical protein